MKAFIENYIGLIIPAAYILFWLFIWMHDRIKHAKFRRRNDQQRPGKKVKRSFLSYLWEEITGKISSPLSPHDEDISRRFF